MEQPFFLSFFFYKDDNYDLLNGTYTTDKRK